MKWKMGIFIARCKKDCFFRTSRVRGGANVKKTVFNPTWKSLFGMFRLKFPRDIHDKGLSFAHLTWGWKLSFRDLYYWRFSREEFFISFRGFLLRFFQRDNFLPDSKIKIWSEPKLFRPRDLLEYFHRGFSHWVVLQCEGRPRDSSI